MFQWLYGLFLDLIAYCANALLGVMSTDMSFFETNVPVVSQMYGIITAVGWGLLIGNCVFQSLKAMMSGLGFEGESPAILLMRTGLYGFLLTFSKSICEIGMGIGGKVITLLGIPTNVTLTFPEETAFDAFDGSWVLVIIIGFVLGFQMIKLFFEIGERYVVVCILTLMCPVGLAMGGSKSTKDICTGYLRCFGSMVLMMVMNVVFLKLILSALSVMPTGVTVLPWCILVVALARVARKADSILAKIGLNPAVTGDPLGRGRGGMVALMAARTIMSSASKGKASAKGGRGRTGNAASYAQSRNTAGASSTNVGGSSVHNSSGTNTNAQNSQTANASASSQYGGQQSAANTQSAQSSRFGSSVYGGSQSGGTVNAGTGGTRFGGGGTVVNTSRFGSAGKPSGTTAKKPVTTAGTKKYNGQAPQPFKGSVSQSKGKTASGQQKKAGFPGTAGSKKPSGINTPANGLRQNSNPLAKPSGITGQVRTTPVHGNRSPGIGGRPVSGNAQPMEKLDHTELDNADDTRNVGGDSDG